MKDKLIIYSKEDIYKKTLEYFQGYEFATKVWISKYCLKDNKGNLYELSPDDMHRRLASEFARIELKHPNPISENEIYELLKDFKYIVPGGNNLSGIGNNFSISSLGNCFVVGNEEDSYGGILKVDEYLVQLMKRRGGVGTALEHLRYENSPTKNSSLSSSGLIAFAKRYSNTTKEVAQNGRRGALMEACSIKHPDILKFIHAKSDRTEITGANISIKFTNQ